MNHICKKNIVLYHLYPVNNWKEITQKLLLNIPHNEIFIHVSLPENIDMKDLEVFLLSLQKVKAVYYSENSKYSEVDGLEKFRKSIDFSECHILTYMHSKGVTKPGNKNISDWTELMHYFHTKKINSCAIVFGKKFKLYGVNKKIKYKDVKSGPLLFSDYHYSGNFVSLNLPLVLQNFMEKTIDKDYYGVEGFWGKLCDSSEAYNVFGTFINHYKTPYPKYQYEKSIMYSLNFFIHKCHQFIQEIKYLFYRFR